MIELIGKLIDGKHLRDEELVEKLNEIYEKEPFKKLVSTMQAVKDFDVKDLKPKKAYIFDAAFGNEKNLHFFSSSIIQLVNGNESLSILFNELPNVQDHAFGQILKSDSNAIQQYLYSEEEITISEFQTELKQLAYHDDTNEELPDNPDYQAGNFTRDIEPQGWFDGCLPGGYQHCGGDCGYGSKYGGGRSINATDTCCISHDNCWGSFGRWDACCDKKLVLCVAGHPTVAATGIRNVFGPSALRCLS